MQRLAASACTLLKPYDFVGFGITPHGSFGNCPSPLELSDSFSKPTLPPNPSTIAEMRIAITGRCIKVVSRSWSLYVDTPPAFGYFDGNAPFDHFP